MGNVLDSLSKREIKLPVIVLEALGNEPEFVVDAAYLDGEDQENMQNSCRHRSRTGEWELDRNKYRDKFCRKVIKGWRGLTLGNLVRLLPNYNSVSPETFSNEYPEGEIPYSHETATMLYQKSRAQDFVNIVTEAFRDTAQVLEAERKLQEKNLSSTPGLDSG